MSAEWHRDWRDRAQRRKLACGRAPTWPWRKGLAYTPVLTRRPWVASNLSVVTGLTFSSGPCSLRAHGVRSSAVTTWWGGAF